MNVDACTLSTATHITLTRLILMIKRSTRGEQERGTRGRRKQGKKTEKKRARKGVETFGKNREEDGGSSCRQPLLIKAAKASRRRMMR